MDSLILRINPSAPTTILPSLAPASVSGGTVSFSVTDTETTENDITDFGTGFFQNNLVASNGNNIFSINTGNIEQRSLSNERQSRFSQTDDIGGKKSLEFYSAANTLLSIDLTLATKIKSYGNSISIRLNDGRVFN